MYVVYTTIPPRHCPPNCKRNDWEKLKKFRGLNDPSLVRIAKYASEMFASDNTNVGLVCSGETQNKFVSTVKLMKGANN